MLDAMQKEKCTRRFIHLPRSPPVLPRPPKRHSRGLHILRPPRIADVNDMRQSIRGPLNEPRHLRLAARFPERVRVEGVDCVPAVAPLSFPKASVNRCRIDSAVVEGKARR